MFTVEEALQRLLSQAHPLQDVKTVATLDAYDRVLAEAVVSPVAVPPMDNSQMDGYAVRCADVTTVPTTLAVSQRIAAGQVGAPLAPGTAARIFTGAPLPAGADAIVMQEATTLDGDRVTINEVPRAGQWIRRVGIDIQADSTILAAGRKLRPQDVGLAASVGTAKLKVVRRLRVAVFF
ncbi:MAG TPA: molybdopterin molybdotransferase MoeA, partial [Burkholderiaceae bacterium]|nr:molybdopterin molybdotransferase MoeA [Burkholderiaceae bacterium]